MRRMLVLFALGCALLAAAPALAGWHGKSASGRATLRAFTGRWFGHTRSLLITRAGRGREHIGDGCCDPVINLTFNLSRPTGTSSNASARLRVTSVHVLDPSAYPHGGEPRVGELRRLRLKQGVIREPASGAIYCDMQADPRGRCGA
jgi:hypothetical protein